MRIEKKKLKNNSWLIGRRVTSAFQRSFAFLAIFILCLGLLGLTMFTTEQRQKEIGIRKILGAPGLSLFGLLSKEMLLLVTLSMFIASPLAWYDMNNWLQSYAYRIDLTFWIFILAGTLAVLIALAATSLQIIKVVVVNPVDTLRSE